jgi:hypothetical protein
MRIIQWIIEIELTEINIDIRKEIIIDKVIEIEIDKDNVREIEIEIDKEIIIINKEKEGETLTKGTEEIAKEKDKEIDLKIGIDIIIIQDSITDMREEVNLEV